MSDTFTVRSNDGRKLYFEGTEEDARQFIVNNFPRLHVEPGVNYGEEGPVPDAVLSQGHERIGFYNGTEWSDQKNEDTQGENVPVNEDAQDDDVELDAPVQEGEFNAPLA